MKVLTSITIDDTIMREMKIRGITNKSELINNLLKVYLQMHEDSDEKDIEVLQNKLIESKNRTQEYQVMLKVKQEKKRKETEDYENKLKTGEIRIIN